MINEMVSDEVYIGLSEHQRNCIDMTSYIIGKLGKFQCILLGFYGPWQQIVLNEKLIIMKFSSDFICIKYEIDTNNIYIGCISKKTNDIYSLLYRDNLNVYEISQWLEYLYKEEKI